jgi:hypothetical protein
MTGTVKAVLASWLLKGDDMDIKTLENSLYWQQVVLKQSRDPVQIERVKQAIIKLQQQISNLGS